MNSEVLKLTVSHSNTCAAIESMLKQLHFIGPEDHVIKIVDFVDDEIHIEVGKEVLN